MNQDILFNIEDDERIDVGGGFSVKIRAGKNGKSTGKVHLDCHVVIYRNGNPEKEVDFKDSVAKRISIVDMVERGANQSKLSGAFDLSRQSIHNWRETKKNFGLEGLINNYKISDSKSRLTQRKENASQLGSGNKSYILEELRQKNQEERDSEQLSFNFGCGPDGNGEKVSADDQLYSEEHDWKPTRYAGVFTYLISLVAHWNWLELIQGFFGNSYRIFLVFLLMTARNVRSLEQLKNIRLIEGGALLGLVCIPAKEKVWQWFCRASSKVRSTELLTAYFRHQFKAGLVSVWLWFTDGHLLPYSGKEKVHKAYNTQRRMPFSGQTNLVSCDNTGRIIDFSIEEGKGDLRQRIVELAEKWSEDLGRVPVMVFDREGSGLNFFSKLVKENIYFATWEKNANKKHLESLDSAKFTETFSFNGKDYRYFEEKKVCEYSPEDVDKQNVDAVHHFVLRRIVIWNLSSNRRASGLVWDGSSEDPRQLTTCECAEAILSRWGASENTFKHLKDRHPFHYHPGFKFSDSKKQLIANPELKESAGKISGLKKRLTRLYRDVTKTNEAKKKDGTLRGNSKKQKLSAQITDWEEKLQKEQEHKSQLPERVDVSTLENYASFKKIDNEGKNLFDFVTTSVWNARKQLIDYIRPDFGNENELVDLFYAITECHGWIKTTSNDVIVRLEPLQQPRRRLAQERLCKKLSQLGAMTPNGKWLSVEVGDDPASL